RRRRSAPDSASTRRRLIPPHPGDQGKCSAKALSQRGFIRATNALQILTVEDQFDLASFRQNRAQAAILSFTRSPDVIMSIDFMYCLRHDFGGTKPSQKNPLKGKHRRFR